MYKEFVKFFKIILGDAKMNFLISLLLTQPGENGVAVTQAAKTVANTAQEAVSEVATQAAQSTSGGFGMWGMVLYILFFVAIFYLLIIRPQKKKDKQIRQMQDSIQIGDDIVTSSGFYGKVVEIEGEVATVEFGTNKGIRIPVRKNEIYGTKAAAAKTDDKAETK